MRKDAFDFLYCSLMAAIQEKPLPSNLTESSAASVSTWTTIIMQEESLEEGGAIIV